MNCVENLPIYTALMVALMASGVRSPLIGPLSIAMLAARVGQTLVHIALPPNNAAVSLRFALFFVQVICMTAIGVVIARNVMI